MHDRLAPPLLALALGLVPLTIQAASAPSDAVRDEHARAIKGAIDLGAKRVAQRQMEEWAKAGYADTGSPTMKEALDIAFRRGFDATFDDASVPKGVQSKAWNDIAGGGGGLDQIIR